MKAEIFVKSWPALWLWMHTLQGELVNSHIDVIYTFRKGRLDLHFYNKGQLYRVGWEKQANQALLTASSQVSLPKKRVAIFKELPKTLRVLSLSIHREDRLLRINFEDNYALVFGFYHARLNVYLFRAGELVDSFLKGEDSITIPDNWMNIGDPLPPSIPGNKLHHNEVRLALEGMSLNPENHELSFGKSNSSELIGMEDLVSAVLRGSQKPKEAPIVSLTKTGGTVLVRWQKKLGYIREELKEAETWPELEIRMQILQIGMALSDTAPGGIIRLNTDQSPTGKPIELQLAPNTSIYQSIESMAKRIRKFKGKLEQLIHTPSQIEEDIKILETLLGDADPDAIQKFLEEHGETLEHTGQQQAKRIPYKKYQSPGGFDILVGRSSSDNDTLTFKVAGKNDWWFHARQIRGSHVILRTGKQIPQKNDIIKAAEHAALNSKAKHAGIVVVQYCQRKHLSKPKGSHPGAVLVHHEKSITIDLDLIK